MQYKSFKILSAVLSVMLSTATLQAQSSFNVSTHTAVIEGNTYEYSIGEMALITTERNTNLIITQGQLQPSPAIATSNNDASDKLSELIKVYPNPVQNELFVDWNQQTSGNVNLQLMDATGKVILKQSHELQSGKHTLKVEMQQLSAGAYYLLFHDAQSDERTSFKITKLN